MAKISKEYQLKVSVKDALTNVEELNKSFEAQEDLISEIEKDLLKYNKQLKDTEGFSGKAMQKREALNKKIEETNHRLKVEKQGLKDVNTKRKRANDELKKATKNTTDNSAAMGFLDRQTGGMVSTLQGFTTGVGGATKGMSALNLVMKASVFGLIVTAIAAVTTALTNSEEGQNKFRRFFTQITTVIGNVTDILGNFGNAIMNVFTGKFKEAKESLDLATLGIKNFGEETRKEIEVAGELADKRADADKMERKLLLERAEANRKVAALREIAADKENVSAADRIKAMKEAGAIEEEITKKEIKAARLRFEAKKTENSLAASTKEDLDEEAALQAKLIELETARLRKQKALTAEITTSLREEKAERNRLINESKAKERELATVQKEIRDATMTTEAEKRELELIKIDEHYEKLIQKAKDNNLAFDELEISQREARLAKEAEHKAIDDAKAKEEADKKLADAKAIADKEAQIEAQKRADREKTFDTAVMLAGEESKVGKALLLVKQVLLAKKMILDAKEQIQNAKKAVTNATINAAESGTEVAKGAAKSAAAAPPPFNIPFILSFAATAVGIISAVKSAVGATKSAAAKAGASGGSIPTIETPSIQATAPTIEPIVPDAQGVGGGGINQLAQAIGGQQQQPIQAFVVSDNVTTAQSLERNIVEGASIG